MPHKSPYRPVYIPEGDLWSLLFERPNLTYSKYKPLFIDPLTSSSYNYSAIQADAQSFGIGLRKHWGWQKGDILCFYTPNHIDTPAITWGVHWAGGVGSPANPLYTVDELAFQLKDSGAKGLITQDACLDVAMKAAERVGLSKENVAVIGTMGEQSKRYGLKHWREICVSVGNEEAAEERTLVDPKTDLCFLCYSSGTTGLPKGVRLTHYNVVANIIQLDAVETPYLFPNAHGGGDKQIAVVPFFHIYGLVVVIHMTLLIGLPSLVLPRFDLEQTCQLIQEHRITYLYVPPPILLSLGKHPLISQYDLSSLRMITSGAAPLTKELVDGVWDRLKIPVKQGYGLTETSPACHLQTLDEWAKNIGSVGRLLPNMEALIVEVETEEEVGDGETGELWVRGPNVFGGYHNRPDLNTQIFGPDGWFKTGDIANVDKKGHFYVTDRLKELIKYKGFQVPPAELEGLLLGHPYISDACVIGVYDNTQATELPRAYVVVSKGIGAPAPDRKLADDIVEWLAKRVAPQKKLRGGVVFMDEIPKNGSGKILRRVLREKIKSDESMRAKL